MSATPAIPDAVTMTAGPLAGYLVTHENLPTLVELLDGDLPGYSTPTLRFRSSLGLITEVEDGDVVVRIGDGWEPIYGSEIGNLWHPALSAAGGPQ